jgi:hypothetical protein
VKGMTMIVNKEKMLKQFVDLEQFGLKDAIPG